MLADFGEFTLRSDNLDEVLTEACRLVGEAMGTKRAKVLEIQDDGHCLLVRAGVGWASEVVGRVRLEMTERSSETFSIKAGAPVITRDISEEDRFDVPAFLKDLETGKNNDIGMGVTLTQGARKLLEPDAKFDTKKLVALVDGDGYIRRLTANVDSPEAGGVTVDFDVTMEGLDEAQEISAP